MSYATPANLRAWFAQQQLEQYLPRDTETTSTALIQQALDAASAEMDSAFSIGEYVVPIDVTTTPSAATRAEILRRHCMALAWDTLRLSAENGLPDNLQAQVNASRRWLQDVRGLQGMRADGSYGRMVSFADLPGLSRSA
jgi:phage gp36-like protein